MYRIAYLAFIQLLYYIRSTQLVLFLIPLFTAFFGITTFLSGVVEHLGLVPFITHLVPQNLIDWLAACDLGDTDGLILRIYSSLAFIIYIIEQIVSRIRSKKFEISSRMTLYHYIAFVVFGLSCMGASFYFFANSTIGEALLVTVVLNIILLMMMVLGWSMTTMMTLFIQVLERGELKVIKTKK